jgi:hypothetical protein
MNTQMTGGLAHTSCDRGTLVFLMGRLQFLMGFQESRNLISKWVQDEHANKTLSLLQGAQMPFECYMSCPVAIQILVQCFDFQTSRASNNNEHKPASATSFLVCSRSTFCSSVMQLLQWTKMTPYTTVSCPTAPSTMLPSVPRLSSTHRELYTR